MSWVQIPPEQLFFLFCEKRVVQVSCIALFIYVGLRVFMYVCDNPTQVGGEWARPLPAVALLQSVFTTTGLAVWCTTTTGGSATMGHGANFSAWHGWVPNGH